MNINNAKNLINNLSPGLYAGRDWFGPGRAVVYFSRGRARDAVADYKLSAMYNSGTQLRESVVVTDKHALRALKKAYPGDS